MWNVIVPLKCRRITNLGISVTLKDVILGSTVTLKEFFWAGWLRRRRMWVWVPMRIFLCGVYMFSLCLCGFSPSTPVSSHCTKTHTFAWFGASKCSSGCESIFVSWYIELRSNLKRPYIQTVPPHTVESQGLTPDRNQCRLLMFQTPTQTKLMNPWGIFLLVLCLFGKTQPPPLILALLSEHIVSWD